MTLRSSEGLIIVTASVRFAAQKATTAQILLALEIIAYHFKRKTCGQIVRCWPLAKPLCFLLDLPFSLRCPKEGKLI